MTDHLIIFVVIQVISRIFKCTKSKTSMTRFISSKNTLLIFIFLYNSLHGYSQAPVISSFSPVTGNIGSAVTITGTGFDAMPANNIVFFGAVKANVTAATTTSLSVTVPAGATYDPITVNTNGLTATSTLKFSVGFAGTGMIMSNSFSLDMSVVNAKPAYMAISDIDGDGKPDIGFYEINLFAGDSIGILRNMSTSDSILFGTAFKIGVSGNPSHKVKIYFKDIDGDSKPDIVALNVEAASMAIFINTSLPGTIAFATRVTVDLGGQNPIRIAFGDIDGNGKTDIVAVSENGDFSILKNSSTVGAISLSMAAGYPTAIDPNVYVLYVNDLDADGKPDIIMGNSWFYSVTILQNTTSGGVISFSNLTVPGFDNTNSVAEPSDIDGDGKLDLLISQFVPGCKIFRNTSTTGSISFTSSDLNNGIVSFNNYINDVSGDGKPEIIVKSSSNTIGIQNNTSNPGSFTFDSPINVNTSPDPIIYTAERLFCDFDLDGRTDILVINSGDFESNFSLLKNNIGRPVITSFTPTSGTDGTVVTITGNNLETANAVSIGGIPMNSFTVINSNTISFTVEGNPAGYIAVTTPYGTDSLAAFNTPVIHSFTPANAGPAGQTSTVTINGWNFNGASAISFGGVPAASFTLVSDTIIVATVSDTGASGNVAVTSSYGTGTRSGFYFAGANIIEFCPTASTFELNANISSFPYYKWQVDIDGSGYHDIADGLYYSGTNTATLQLINFPSQWSGFRFRLLASIDNITYATFSGYFKIKAVDRWTGGASTAWEDPANWSCGSVPDSFTNVIINSGAVVVLNSNTTINSLSISPGASLTVASGAVLTILH